MTRGMINFGVTNFGGDLFGPRPLGHDPKQIEKEKEERRNEQQIVKKKCKNVGIIVMSCALFLERRPFLGLSQLSNVSCKFILSNKFHLTGPHCSQRSSQEAKKGWSGCKKSSA